MNPIQLSVERRVYRFDEKTLHSRLINLRNAKGSFYWIKGDLRVSKFTWFNRLIWLALRKISFIRNFFYQVNLEHSKKLLEALHPHLVKHKKIYKLYKEAVASFEEIAPKHKVFSHSSQKRLDFQNIFQRGLYKCLVSSSMGRFNGLTNRKIACQVFAKLKENEPLGISYNGKKMSWFVFGGNCSALSLDFIEKYFQMLKSQNSDSETSEEMPKKTLSYDPTKYAQSLYGRLSNDIDPKEFTKKITEIGKQYISGGRCSGRLTEFRSRQNAFNCIEVKKEIENVDFSHAKVQSLANFHDLKISYDSGFFHMDIDPISKLKKKVNSLPEGVYLLRVTKPKDNEKLEEHGHSMVLIRAKQGDYFYDPNVGTEKIEEETAGRIFTHLKRNWNRFRRICDARFYQLMPSC